MRTRPVTLKRARKLRRTMTLPELLLWEKLRGDHLNGVHFRRQHPMGPYILDFYCCTAKLAVEVDGLAHESEEQGYHDKRRDDWLAGLDIRVLRIPARDILNDETLDGALVSIVQAALAPSASPGSRPGSAPPPLRGGGAFLP